MAEELCLCAEELALRTAAMDVFLNKPEQDFEVRSMNRSHVSRSS